MSRKWLLSANIHLLAIERAKGRGTVIFLQCIGESFSYHKGLKRGTIIRANMTEGVLATVLSLMRSGFWVFLCFNLRLGFSESLGSYTPSPQRSLVYFLHVTLLRSFKYCSLELQVIKLKFCNFIKTKVAGKL